MNVTLLDYGVGNTASVRRAFERLGAVVDFTSEPERVARSRRIVLPGVGAFAPARARLAETGLEEALRRAVASGARLLGLCLGFQLLFESSEEFGTTPGLGLVEGRVRPFPPGVRSPHVGWNALGRPEGREPRLLAGVPDGSYVYFVHSFRPEGVPADAVAAWTHHGGPFPSAVESGEVWGCQFHPEKSSAVGRLLLRRFLAREGS